LQKKDVSAGTHWDSGFSAASSHAPYRAFNIGNHTPVQLMDFIGTIEKVLG
jgi:hypothetical protein